MEIGKFNLFSSQKTLMEMLFLVSILRRVFSDIGNSINKFSIFVHSPFWIYFCWINMSNMTPKKTFLIAIFDID